MENMMLETMCRIDLGRIGSKVANVIKIKCMHVSHCQRNEILC